MLPPDAPLPDSEPPIEASWRALFRAALPEGDARDEHDEMVGLVEIEAVLATSEPEPLSKDVCAALLEAPSWTAVVPGRDADAPRTAVRLPRREKALEAARQRWWWARAAALLLVGLGVALLWLVGGQEAAGGVRLGAVYRLDLSEGRPVATAGWRLAAGDEVAAPLGTALGLRLEGRGTVVVTPGGVVAAGSDGTLEVVAGEVLVAATHGTVPVTLPSGARLEIDGGRAWIAAQPLRIALAARTTGRFVEPSGAVEDLVGPLERPAPAGDPEDATATERFAPLDRFASARSAPRGRIVEARRWRAPGGGVRRVGDLLVLTAGADGEQRVVWRVAPALAGARALEVRLDAPAGTRVLLPALGIEVALEGVTQTTTVNLPLPDGWRRRLLSAAEELELVIRWPEASTSSIRFHGAAFLDEGPAPAGPVESTR